MPWHRHKVGHVRDGNLVHYLYEWFKSERKHWDTQCGIRWGSRDNTSMDLQPRTTKKPVTCIECLALQLRIGAEL